MQFVGKAVGNLVAFACVNFVSYLPIDRPTKAIGLLFVFLLGLAEERSGESYCFRFSFGESLSLGIEQPVFKNGFNASPSLPVE
jgi:hypothetical protein